jgi:hypothetical protein
MAAPTVAARCTRWSVWAVEGACSGRGQDSSNRPYTPLALYDQGNADLQACQPWWVVGGGLWPGPWSVPAHQFCGGTPSTARLGLISLLGV